MIFYLEFKEKNYGRWLVKWTKKKSNNEEPNKKEPNKPKISFTDISLNEIAEKLLEKIYSLRNKKVETKVADEEDID
jgi:hypothetical protein